MAQTPKEFLEMMTAKSLSLGFLPDANAEINKAIYKAGNKPYSASDYLYLMHGGEVVHIGNENTLTHAVNSFNPST